MAFTRAAFEWVRDSIGHSYDVSDPRITLSATEVLEHRVGLCYAKSHLLAALLRAEGIPTGLCYQPGCQPGWESPRSTKWPDPLAQIDPNVRLGAKSQAARDDSAAAPNAARNSRRQYHGMTTIAAVHSPARPYSIQDSASWASAIT